jgi:hypothetical protein
LRRCSIEIASFSREKRNLSEKNLPLHAQPPDLRQSSLYRSPILNYFGTLSPALTNVAHNVFGAVSYFGDEFVVDVSSIDRIEGGARSIGGFVRKFGFSGDHQRHHEERGKGTRDHLGRGFDVEFLFLLVVETRRRLLRGLCGLPRKKVISFATRPELY